MNTTDERETALPPRGTPPTTGEASLALVSGGQGHTAEELASCAYVTGVLMLTGAVIVIFLALFVFSQK